MINFIQGRHMIDFRFLVKKSLAVLKFMLLPVLLHTAAVKAEVTYIHTDYLGSVSAKSNASGQVIERFHYAPFGLPADSSELNNKQSYTGHVFDNESQLIYMQARYYDPVIGRFYSNDPADMLEHVRKNNIVHGFNRYTYANNNPYKFTDPDGRFIIPLPIPVPLPIIPPVTPPSGNKNGNPFTNGNTGGTKLPSLPNIFPQKPSLSEQSEQLPSEDDISSEEIEDIYKDCLQQCIDEAIDDYENGDTDKIEHDKIVKEARDRLDQILREIQKH